MYGFTDTESAGAPFTASAGIIVNISVIAIGTRLKIIVVEIFKRKGVLGVAYFEGVKTLFTASAGLVVNIAMVTIGI